MDRESTQVTSQTCPQGWGTQRYSPTWPCYLMTNKIKRTWPDAQKFCEQMGGSLLKLESVQERDWVFGILKSYQGFYPTHTEWWIGLHDYAGQVQWTDKTYPQANLLPWVTGEPAQYDRSKACVEYINGSIRHQDCSQPQYFACKRPRESAIWCDAINGWESINQMCYKLITKLKSWDDARGECQKESADLMVVKDVSTQQILNNFVESRHVNLWIGLKAFKNITGNGYFSWLTSNGAKLNMVSSFFNSQTPLNAVISSNYTQSCVFANSSLQYPNLWQTGHCDQRSFSVCQKPEGRCSAGWMENDFVCYLLVTAARDWTQAKDYCDQRGATLLHIQSSSEQQFINSILGSIRARGIGSFWLGLSDNNSSRWTWADNSIYAPNSPYLYNNLNGQNPTNGPGMQCFNIYTDDVNGTWQLANYCMSNKSFLCQIQAQKPPKLPTTPPPTGSTMIPAQTSPTSPVTWSSDCGPFWIKDSKTGYCYKFSDNTLSWFQARHSCESQGAQLTSINTYHEQTFITDFVYGYKSPEMWIGTSNLNWHSGYNWIDGTGFGYINWSPGEPNNYHDNEHCASLIVGGEKMGQWNDMNCDQRRGYICKRRSTDFSTLPPPTTPYLPAGKIFGCPNSSWLAYGNNCFLFKRTNISWTDARSFCEADGHNLASISNQNEQNFIFSHVPPNSGYRIQDQYWIGLNDIGIQMIFQWTDGTPVRYTNWNEREPNNFKDRREDCVTIYHEDGKWNDAPCYTPRAGFVCKTPKTVLDSSVVQANMGTGCRVAGAVAYGYFCYLIKQGPKTWSVANLDCSHSNAGGSLVSIHDSYQQAFLASQIAGSSGYYWIGLSDKAINGTLAWADGLPYDFTAWSANHTGNNYSICISMRTQGPLVGLWVDQKCLTQQKYICQFPRTGFITHKITPTTSPPTPFCPNGWYDYNGYCYKINAMKQTWFGARESCQSVGADLISIHSSSEERNVFSNKNMLSLYRSSFWIGLNDFGIEKNFKWTDGTVLGYTNWANGEPNDADGTDDCVEYYGWRNSWNDNSCYLAKPFVCKIQKGKTLHTPKPTMPTTVPADCGQYPGWKLYNGSCYLTSDNVGTNSRRTWFGARDFCNQQGAELASVHSEEENGFLVTLVSIAIKHDAWIGFKDVGQNQFHWTDNSLVDYTKWSGNEPNDAFGSEDCALIAQWNGYWNDNDCNENYHFICKKPRGSVHPITPIPTALSTGACPPGYTGVKTGNKCFKIYGARDSSERRDFLKARDSCRSQGPLFDIASFGSHVELATVVFMSYGVILDTSVDIWIGLNDLNKNYEFTWQDNSRLSITNWDKGQPTRSGGQCVAMSADERHAGKWHNKRCSTVTAYVCETYRNNSISPTKGPAMCQNAGYISNGLDCFKLHTELKTFAQAERICMGENTHLASIMGVYEQAYIDSITGNINSPIWIGLRDPGDTGTYSWSDNSPVIYSSWNKGEPTYQPGEGCVSTHLGFWNDSICQNPYPFVCKELFFTPPTPTGFPSGFCKDITWRQHNDDCYYVNLNTPLKTWSQADQDCVSRGMQLVSIKDINEENFILQELDRASQVSIDLWIGFKRIGGYFQWSDGTQIAFINWLNNPGHQDCVVLKADSGKWVVQDCNQRHGYVCKTPKCKSMPATSPTTPTTTISTASSTTSSTASSTTSSTSSIASSSGSATAPSLPSSSVTTQSPQKSPRQSNTQTGSSTTASPPIASTTGISITSTTAPTQSPQKSPQQSNSRRTQTVVESDLSGGQIAGIIIGVMVLIAIMCGALFYLKHRSTWTLFNFAKLREGDRGFDNAAYDKQMQSVQINGITSLDHNHTMNGHGIGFSNMNQEEDA